MLSDATLESVHIRHSGQEADQVIEASFAMFKQLGRHRGRILSLDKWPFAGDPSHESAGQLNFSRT